MSKKMKLFNIFLIICIACYLFLPVFCLSTQVTSNGVTYLGFQNGNVSSFIGIRYGQETSGNNRFKITVPFLYDQSSVVNATSFGHVCPQPTTATTLLSAMSEDCLNLNIWTPMLNESVQVMVWIHGGSFTSGSGSIYDGSYWCSKAAEMGIPVVLVTINYRLGSLGFLSDKTSGVNGNFGLYDQLEAIRWVKVNIRNFGGNPDKITVAGESAGGMSIACLLSTSIFSSENLFQQSIIQSGILPSSVLQNTLDGAQAFTNILKSRVSCFTLACLRQLPFADFITAQRNMTFVPVVDGQLLSETIYQNLDKVNNPISNISMMVGTTRNETTAFTCDRGSNLNIYQLYVLFRTLFNMEPLSSIFELLAQVSILYGGQGTYSSILQFFNVFMTDALFYCPARYYSSVVSEMQKNVSSKSRVERNVYQYVFSYVQPKLGPCYGAPHASELPYLFPSILDEIKNNPDLSGMFSDSQNLEFSDKDRKISDSMIYYWTNFIKYGKPDGENPKEEFPNWISFNRCEEKLLYIDIPLKMEQAMKETICNFWDDQFGRKKIEKHC
ncbi:predicted protein [Naegleria gruberi]|uniref:Carboxylic ester hydrolase n=1 Tax=Naegleria gruberi TaxID=5762 RepID=D2VVG8_NAEGR|nr:uncharacterized protein NAEGRDRAFT_73015 [Naegleria gruberi]EFC39235.1 predicted protein [Naegleria gruberi]|eukprot:XP_002671979.1 predicted protein [Naegleria gruberi strain NEG-M]